MRRVVVVLFTLVLPGSLVAQSISIEVGGDAISHRYTSRTQSYAGAGLSAAAIAEVGRAAIAVGYRSLSVDYGSPGSRGYLHSLTGELRVPFMDDGAVGRPYASALASYGGYSDGFDGSAKDADAVTYGGALGLVLRLSPRVGVNLAGRGERTLIGTDADGNDNGWMWGAHVALTLRLTAPR